MYVEGYHQRRQSGLKSGGRGSGAKKSDFSRQISKKFRLFQAISQKNFDFFQKISQKNLDCSGKFNKTSDFFRQFKKMLISQAKIGHLQIFLSKLFYLSSKVTT